MAVWPSGELSIQFPEFILASRSLLDFVISVALTLTPRFANIPNFDKITISLLIVIARLIVLQGAYILYFLN